ncbi:SDR family NAD(P)-dependent oxidoreductase [Lentzea californiensis]|uniref:SDR family NAD(P)-dependent oxidoreductase n=1 Tax=Lentzea californiensis TaxID=438851 RepID=UPI0021650092|nr:SDR family NAD(P)-dependent oxidoreductase [Lentzea californiensis]MCR3749359.1 short chain dehydrogenase [Lentzea californiensis]
MTDRITEADLATFHEAVARLRALPADDPVRLKAERVAESFAREGRKSRRKVRGAEHALADAAVDAATATGALDRREDAPLPPVEDARERELARARRCYVCKELYRRADAFYHRLCPACARENTERRSARTDLTGRRALLTGGRVKIGFQVALMLLRDGAELLVTTRFPRDARRRFEEAPGSAEWLHRLTVVGIDLRDPRQVLGLTESLREDGRPLDVLVNNAAQTVRRPPESYAALIAGESGAQPHNALLAPGFSPMLALEQNSGALALAEIDEAGLLPDTAPVNSWSARVGELDAAEVLETQLVNALAPTLLCDRLLPLLLASPHSRRYVVNVTAVEGRFAVRNKTSGHPHTNMAKAALNMLTRTSGPDLAEQGVYMCSVDTGWITDENPAPKKARLAEVGFRTPLDVVDGAARVYDPIVRGEAGEPFAGVFLKDYREAAW